MSYACNGGVEEGCLLVLGLCCCGQVSWTLHLSLSAALKAMFNAPRSPSNRYGSPLSNGLLGSSTSLVSDPLVASAYIDPDAGLDPWSTNPSPAPLTDPPSALNAVLGVSNMVDLSKAKADGIR